MNIKKQIGQRIQIERKAKGLTQAELARLAGDLKQPRINNWENGLRTPGLEEVKEIARVLEVSPAYLMCITDRKTLHPLEKEPIGALAPLLSQKQTHEASYWLENVLQESYDGDIAFIPISPELTKIHGSNLFAFEIKDESMRPELLEGDILIIAFDLLPKPGNFVVAKINADEIIVRRYKQLSTSNADFELLSINSHWPHIQSSQNPGCKLLGTAVQIIRTLIK